MPPITFPDPLPPWIRNHPLRSAEVKVYDSLHAQLPHDCYLFYSRPWLGTNRDGSEKEGEADFVVASERTGFLVLEVKGGGVGRDALTDRWSSIDREGRRHTIKNPVSQCVTGKHELLNRLRVQPELANTWIGAGIAVVLPDSTGKFELNSLDTPADRFALTSDMPRLGDWVRSRLELTVGTKGGALGAGGIRALERLLAHSFQLRVPGTIGLEADQEQILVVTEQQYSVLSVLDRQHRAAIAGAAGSGKTILALRRALDLAERYPARRVLLTCFNRPLAEWLARRARKMPALQVGSFHQVCRSLANTARIPLPADESDQEAYWGQSLPDALLDAVDRNPSLLFDAIIVDEGQDFQDRWLEVLQLALRNDGSPFWVFYDDNQKLYGTPSSILHAMPQSPYALTQNVRNPRHVFEKLQPLLGDQLVRPLGPEGQPVETITVSDNRELKLRLSTLVTTLIEEEEIDPNDIAVLVPGIERSEALLNRGKLGRWTVCQADEEPNGRVCMDTVRRFKGLERKVIILVDPEKMVESDEVYYVALSRATGHLILIGKNPD